MSDLVPRVPSHAAVLAEWEPELASLVARLRQATAELCARRQGAPRGAPVIAETIRLILRAHVAAVAFQAQSTCLDHLVRLRMNTLRTLPPAEREKLREAHAAEPAT